MPRLERESKGGVSANWVLFFNQAFKPRLELRQAHSLCPTSESEHFAIISQRINY